MSENLKSTHVRLSHEGHEALTALAQQRGKPLSVVAQEILVDALYGFGRGPRRQANEKTAAGFVYVIRVGDLYKIGKATDVAKRIAGMTFPSKPEVICTIRTDDRHRTERELHAHYKSVRGHGEWFALRADQLETLKTLAAEAEV